MNSKHVIDGLTLNSPVNLREHRMSPYRQRAIQFLESEREFRLGTMTTESSHPKTARLSQTMEQDTQRGIQMLLEVDSEITPAAQRAFESHEFGQLAEAICEAVLRGNRVFFTGCGATGRLSILLEAAWRRFWQKFKQRNPSLSPLANRLQDAIHSVMAGGDYALIRSVEGFEDFPDFGKYQLGHAGVKNGDVVVAITEGGETFFVIGTAWKGVEMGARTFFVYNNPSHVLRENVERSRQVLDDDRITKLDLSSGPMAVTGSTRMQATTSELLVVGAALEMALIRILEERLSPDECVEMGIRCQQPREYRRLFADLIEQLRMPAAVSALAAYTEFEESIYRQQGLVTYLTDEFLLDILTDTTERAPTFRCPPFRNRDDRISARSWAFIKNPLCSTPEAWHRIFRREPRGLDWTKGTYRRLNAPEILQAAPPKLDNDEIMKFLIGNEVDPSRFEAPESAAVAVLVGHEITAKTANDSPFTAAVLQRAEPFRKRALVSVGDESAQLGELCSYHIPCRLEHSPLLLWERLAVKLVFNTISTATMARMGRVVGNYMVHVETTNKKLIDRGSRLVSELAGLTYEEACIELHKTMTEIEGKTWPGGSAPSPVALTIERLAAKPGKPHFHATKSGKPTTASESFRP